jgi:hypothetical protein
MKWRTVFPAYDPLGPLITDASVDELIEVIIRGMPSELAERIRNHLNRLKPSATGTRDAETTKRWDAAQTQSPSSNLYQAKLKEILIEDACAREYAPHVARGLLRNGRLRAVGGYIHDLADRLKKCPGTNGFTDKDWTDLEELVRAAPKP